MVEQTEVVLEQEQERLAPLKVLTQYGTKSLAIGLEKVPELELVGEVDLQAAREGSGAGADFDSINFKMISGSIKKAQESGAEILFFTNEQQDQLGVCARKVENGPFQILTAHQIALLLSEVLIEQYREQEVEENAKEPLIVRSIVLSEVLEMQAAYKKVKSILAYSGLEDLNRAIEECTENYFILLAVDEANHILFPGSSAEESIEKAIQLIAEKALALKKEGKTLVDFLFDLYKKYGFYQEKSFTIVRGDADGEKYLKSIMDELRKQSPDFLFGQSIRQVNDFNKRTFHNLLTAKKGKTTLPKANILQLLFADNTKITFVPSEDYSKLFYHFSVSSRIHDKEAFEEAKMLANEQIIKMMEKIGKI